MRHIILQVEEIDVRLLFYDDDDRKQYLALLEETRTKFPFIPSFVLSDDKPYSSPIGNKRNPSKRNNENVALSLDGSVHKVTGLLPALIAAKSLGFEKVYLPYDSDNPFEMINDSLNGRAIGNTSAIKVK